MFCLHMGLMTEENVKNKSAGKFLRLMNALARWKCYSTSSSSSTVPQHSAATLGRLAPR